jgi:tetratricopeptide (TPR) repeat protein
VFDNQWSLGGVLLKTRRYQEAALHYQQALLFRPGTDWVLLGLGDALNGEGQRTEARQVWKKALAAATIPLDPYYQNQAQARLAKR